MSPTLNNVPTQSPESTISPTTTTSTPKPTPTQFGVDPNFGFINLCDGKFPNTNQAVLENTLAQQQDICQSNPYIDLGTSNNYWQIGSYGQVYARILLQNQGNTEPNSQRYTSDIAEGNTAMKIDGEKSDVDAKNPDEAVLTIFVGAADGHANVQILDLEPIDKYTDEQAAVNIGTVLIKELKQNGYIS